MKQAKWIWINAEPAADEYGEFYDRFDFEKGSVQLSISADSNYAVWLNGALVAFSQYADYPYDKVYDTVDLTAHCRVGRNHLCVVVWYYGIDTTQTYYKGNAGLLYAVTCEGRALCRSGADTLCRLSPTYQNHRQKLITTQLGFGFSYDCTAEDGWLLGELRGFSTATVVGQALPLRPRPCKRLQTEKAVCGREVKEVAPNEYIFDLGINTVGFLTLEIESEMPQNIRVSYGEHLSDGVVRRIIGSRRDFSVEVRVKEGVSTYTNPFRRLGCKYLQIAGEAPFKVRFLGIVPTVYPLSSRPRPALTKVQNAIYDMCERTLRLCMHEHYEDCPWREQALYCMDSRNQMLCGYHTFGEYVFPRANLELIAADDRPDGLLSICYPMTGDLVIPSFSLHFFTQCAEYLLYSGDVAFLRRIYPKLQSILSVFTTRMEENGGIVPPFEGKTYWNFYEWSHALSGSLKNEDAYEPDVVLNALLSLALQHMAKIGAALGDPTPYATRADALNGEIRSRFFDPVRGLFADRVKNRSYSVLGNALCVLCGAAGEDAAPICQKIWQGEALTPISLSMRCFLYDACLAVDKKGYTPRIFDDIERIYTPMLEAGIGTVWETEQGDRDFGNAGSLCHGWSAMPVYYYHLLK